MSSTNKTLKIVIALVLITGLGVLAWLVYLNGNFYRLPSRTPNPNAGLIYNDTSFTLPPAALTVRPGPTPVKALSTPTNEPQPTGLDTVSPELDGRYIDPQSESAVRILLAAGNGNSNPGTASLLPLPAQYRPGPYSPLGAPSINFETFYYFLKQANSPALPEAVLLYNTCIKLYCDPAVALAFFEHESSMGKQGASAENKSWGNIRCTEGFACRTTSNNGKFKIYPTWNDGLIDWVILMRETYATKWKLFSLEEIIPRYAPSADNNDPNGYINTIKKLVTRYRNYYKP